jgi:DNA-binding beta-propeller fold protein YncE
MFRCMTNGDANSAVSLSVMLAKAGIQWNIDAKRLIQNWIPAFAGMTKCNAVCHLLLVFAALIVGQAQASDNQVNNTTGTNGLIMIDKLGSLVRFFDPNMLKEISTLTIDGTPHELAISPDRKTAYIPNYGDGVYGRNPNPGHTIAVIDLATRKVRANIDISPNVAPHGLQVDANGTLYASCDISRTLVVIDPKSLKVTAYINTEGTGHWVAVLADGSKAYVANKNDRPFVSVIDLRAKKMIGTVPMPTGTQGIVASPDDKQVLAMDLVSPRIAVIDTKTDTIVEEIALSNSTKGAWGAKYSLDGSTLVVVSVNDRTATLLNATDWRAPQTVLKVGSAPFGIAFTADKKSAFISNHGDGTISVIDLQSKQVANSFAAGKGIETLSFY